MDKQLGYFKKLYQNHREYALLQWLYGAIAVVSVFVCGVIALMNQSLGVALLIVPGVFAVAFVANLVVWSLLDYVLKSAWGGGRSAAEAKPKK